MRDECYQCHIRTVNKLIEKYKPPANVSKLFVRAIHKLLNDRMDIANPYLATEIHRFAKDIINHPNLYSHEKFSSNEMLLNSYEKWRAIVMDSRKPLQAAAKLAVVANILDYGAHSVPDDINMQITNLFKKDFAIDQSEELVYRLGESKKILYLGDNAGEIVFDKLFIEMIRNPNITYVVRGKPVINDVTIDDARQTGIDEVCNVITNGYDAPSTLLEYCSEEFIQEFKKADLIISKGQGNFEGLMHLEHPNMFFLLMAKCKPMAELLGVIEGGMIIKKIETTDYVL
jgi:damage-control phosphatase, subfamily I